MSEQSAPFAVTLAAAASRLQVQPQRISQLLRSGELTGPHYPPPRAPKNAPRVFVESLERYVAARLVKPPRVTDGNWESRFAALEERLRAVETTSVEAVMRRERAHQAAALHLKVAADQAQALLRREQEQTEHLRAENERLRAAVYSAEIRSDSAADLARHYADALTPYLTPDDLRDL